MLTAPANARRPASVSFTFFHDVCRTQATSVTAVYFDSRAQDRSMTVDGNVGGHVVVAR